MLSVSFQHWQERHFAGYWLAVVMTKEGAMKALVVLTAAALALSCVAASAQYVGKGKAPPRRSLPKAEQSRLMREGTGWDGRSFFFLLQ